MEAGDETECLRTSHLSESYQEVSEVPYHANCTCPIPSKSLYQFEQYSVDMPQIHWCAKIKDEVEKLAYQLNEEAERTERPIRRLSKVMYGSTCADMQVDVMGECLSSIKHVVGVRSVFLAKRLHAV
ncbi:uncharacterized protein TNCV_2784981 [Trichonephila clavipes]|nr:uncharacterized protein TNCV_2784981 [Trichonephila clavipes]